ncbi:MAG: hypothetical protein WA726_09875 [Acidimicrobiia bacterium]
MTRTIAGHVARNDEGIGCRDAAIATAFLLGFAICLFAVGLTLINRDACTGACETVGLTLLYAGGPVSAVIGFFSDSVTVAWPLDVTFWVVLAFLVARISAKRRIGPLGLAVGFVAIALVFGLVLSQFVELAV